MAAGGCLFFWVLSFLGCGLNPIVQDTGGGAGSEVDRGDPVDFLVYPADDQNQILIYTGHGGAAMQPNSEVRSAWAADGWSVREADVIPSDLYPFRLIVFVDTGSDPTVENTVFSDEDIASLSRSVERGTRLLFLQNRQADGRCGTDAVLQLANAWALSFVFGQGLSDEVAPQDFDVLATASQPLEQATTITMKEPCTLTDGGTWLIRSEEVSLMSQFRPGNAGDMIFAGDVDLFRDVVVDPATNDNLLLAQNLARVTP